ncbi:hypothetical protein OZX56_05140 [Lactobacillus sp. ESL0684]|uniref:hypothetical protein n=1 Tax=Lactobacillus sp. ESL0684 TaxID=2983213 RepID=UPI0023F8FF59|nr:hypothetical protein [Lactobacillus sp. ESL0684]WEV42934.1 hypothetical protein OZX56_05140 [Lactobacillus sp. ESL0684]
MEKFEEINKNFEKKIVKANEDIINIHFKPDKFNKDNKYCVDNLWKISAINNTTHSNLFVLNKAEVLNNDDELLDIKFSKVNTISGNEIKRSILENDNINQDYYETYIIKIYVLDIETNKIYWKYFPLNFKMTSSYNNEEASDETPFSHLGNITPNGYESNNAFFG